MIIGQNIVPFITEFVDALDQSLSQEPSGRALSKTQKYWLAFCLMGILATRSVCWAKFERASLGSYRSAALSWVFHHSPIPWELLLRVSIHLIFTRYGLNKGSLVIDDSDNKRSKNTKKIWHVHKMKDKASGGYVMGQGLVFMVLVTPAITLPVGVEFYMPDPDYTAWKKKHDRLKKAGVPRKQRPAKPAPKAAFPTKIEIALQLLRQFQTDFPSAAVKCIIADALYGTKVFFKGAAEVYPDTQIISQLRKNQNILFRNRKMSVTQYFERQPGVPQSFRIRGGELITAIAGSARLQVCCHGRKLFVIALKYEGEDDYRFIIASNLSWRTCDIIEAYSQRWLVEVFIQDWKANEGWATLTKLQGEKGSRRGMILSLLVDHCLFFHPDQTARLKNKQPAFTVGCLRRRTAIDSLFLFITEILEAEQPHQVLNQKFSTVKGLLLDFEKSKKHMIARNLGRMEPTESLKYRAAA